MSLTVHDKRQSYLSRFTQWLRRTLFQAFYNGQGINSRIRRNLMQPQDWKWLTIDQIQHCDWQLLFQRIPIEHIPDLVKKMGKMGGVVGVTSWRTHLLCEFLEAHRQPEESAHSKERIFAAFRDVEPAALEELIGLLQFEELQWLAPILCANDKLGYVMHYFKTAPQDLHAKHVYRQNLGILLLAILMDGERLPGVRAAIVAEYFANAIGEEEWADLLLPLLNDAQLRDPLLQLFSEPKLQELPHQIVDRLLTRTLLYFNQAQPELARQTLLKARALSQALGHEGFVQHWLNYA